MSANHKFYCLLALTVLCGLATMCFLADTRQAKSAGKINCLENCAEASTGQGLSKWDLWTNGAKLRGANIWLKRVKPEDYLGPGPVGPPYIEKDFKKLKALGANYVNISYPGIYEEEKRDGHDYTLEEPVLRHLQTLISYCRTLHLPVVISYRTGPQRNEKEVFVNNNLSPLWCDTEAQAAWVKMWQDTAVIFKDEPTVIGYDLMVEPETKDGEVWSKFASQLVEAIRDEHRGNDSLTPILIGGPEMSGADSLGKLNLDVIDRGRNRKIVYTAHQYEPSTYVQQSEGARIYDCDSGKTEVEGKLEYAPYDRKDKKNKEALAAAFLTIQKWKREKGVPVAVNEFGVIRWAGKESKADGDKFLIDEFNLLEENGLNSAIWKWDPIFCLGDDDYNFMHGQKLTNHQDIDNPALNPLVREILNYWDKNKGALR